MPQADWFVDSTNGNDGNNGTTWALAKATLNAGLALVDGVGQTVAVAPGTYHEAVTDPGNAGSSGNQNILVGDTLEEWTDGSAATHGLGNGVVCVTQLNVTNSHAFEWAANHNYWSIRRIAAFSRNYNGLFISSAPADIELIDCFGYGGNSGINISGGTGGSDSQRIYRSIGIGAKYGGLLLGRTLGSFDSSPAIEVYHSIGIGGGRNDSASAGPAGMFINGGGASNYSYVKFVGCLGICLNGKATTGQVPSGMSGRNATYSKADLTRCYAHGYHGFKSFNGASTLTNCYYTKHPSGTSDGGTEVAVPQFIFQVPRLIGFAGRLEDVLTDYSGGLSDEELYDMFGHLLDQSVGAEEWLDETYIPGYMGYNSESSLGQQWINDYTAT